MPFVKAMESDACRVILNWSETELLWELFEIIYVMANVMFKIKVS